MEKQIKMPYSEFVGMQEEIEKYKDTIKILKDKKQILSIIKSDFYGGTYNVDYFFGEGEIRDEIVMEIKSLMLRVKEKDIQIRTLEDNLKEPLTFLQKIKNLFK